MSLLNTLKSVPKEKIRGDGEIKEAYRYLEEIFK